MSPETLFWFALAAKMATSGALIIAATFATERFGAFLGAMIATLPLSMGPAYAFLAMDHPPSFIARSATASVAINAGTILLALTYAALAQRRGLIVSLGGGVLAWFATAALVRSVDWTVAGALAFSLGIAIPCIWLGRPFLDRPMPAVRRRWYDVPFRAIVVATFVGIVVLVSPHLGPTLAGLLAPMPIMMTSIVAILHPRLGGPATGAIMAHGLIGLLGVGFGLAAIALTAEPFGNAVAIALLFLVSIAWNLMLWFCRRRGWTLKRLTAFARP